jgi:hypothetical protein
VVPRNSNEAMVTPMVWSVGFCVLRESGVIRLILCWCVWQISGFSHCEDVFTFCFVYRDFINFVLLVSFLRIIWNKLYYF